MREPTEMELRVAATMVKALSRVWADLDSVERGIYTDVARAAIRAMREPTKDMIIKGNYAADEHVSIDHGYPSTGPSVEIDVLCAAATWKAMLNVASPPD